MLERFALEQLHDKERLSLVFADVMNGADVGMIDARSAVCFSPESLEGGWIRCQVLRQQLQRYFPAQTNILRAVDDPHASPAKMLNDSIMRNSTAEHGLAGA
jgi:hypothetical protein